MAVFFQVLSRSLTLAAATILLPPMLFAATGWSVLGSMPLRNLILLGFIVFLSAVAVQVLRRYLRRAPSRQNPS